MLSFYKNKQKKLSFDILLEGADINSLEFYFRLFDGKKNYGIKGELDEHNKIVFDIPPLTELINEENIKDSYEAKLEVVSNSKYYLLPFQDEVRIKKEPKISVSVFEEKEVSEDIFLPKLKVTEAREIETENKTVIKEEIKETKEEKSKEKTSKFRGFIKKV
jgi:hypothetical protein